MIKVTYIISNIDKAPFFENTFRLIDKSKFEITVILLNAKGSNLEDFLSAEGIYCKRILYRGTKDYPRAIFGMFSLLRKIKPDIVHAHLIDAGVLGLFAAFLARIRNRIYTRHGGSQRIYLQKGVKHDKATDKLATHIIATCENVKQILIDEENVPAKKISIINLAFETKRFQYPDPGILAELKQKYNPRNRGPVVGVISRWVEWKGIQYILPAYRKFLEKYPNALLILANTNGNYTPVLKEMVSEFKPEEITLIPFEKNLYELYQVFDYFVHVPIGKPFEAFGQIYIESLVAGIPSVFTMTGIAPEIIQNGYNALVVDYKNSDQIYEALEMLVKNPQLRQQLIENGKKSIEGRFTFEEYIKATEQLYIDKSRRGNE